MNEKREMVSWRFRLPPGVTAFHSVTVQWQTDDSEVGHEWSLHLHQLAVEKYGPIGQLEKQVEPGVWRQWP